MLALTIGMVLDLIIGDPYNPFHPVRIIGGFGLKVEKFFRKILKNNLKIAGLLTWLIILIATFSVTRIIVVSCYNVNNILGTLVEGILLYFCISSKGLRVEGMKVLDSLMSGDLNKARKQLSYIVGRDTENLDEAGVTRAVIETVAENMSDGVIAPIFFAVIGGAPFAMAYKAINTCDSMFGYKNDKYIDFGFVSAKMDDVANYIPARLTAYLIIIASMITGFDYKGSYMIYKRDRYNHTSPNSAHPEAAVAGALGIQLGGDNYYFGKLVEKPTIGDTKKTIDKSDLHKTNQLLMTVTFLAYFISIFIMYVGGKVI